MVVLDVCAQRQRHRIEVVIEEDGRAGRSLQGGSISWSSSTKSRSGPSSLVLFSGDDLATPLPCGEGDEDDQRDPEREPAAVDDLGQVRREEGEVDEEEGRRAGDDHPSGFFQIIRTTTKKRIVSIARVPVTAIP